MTPLERKFPGGGGGLIGRTIRGGYGYFLELHNMWVEIVVGSLLVQRGFSPGTPVFPLSSKTNTAKFQIRYGMHRHMLNELLSALKVFHG